MSTERRRQQQREWARRARAEGRIKRNYAHEYARRSSKPGYREETAERQRRRYARPDARKKAIARAKAQDLVRRGVIMRQHCERCGKPDAQMHHDDYDKPLEVRWLCVDCHRAEHARIDDPTDAGTHG